MVQSVLVKEDTLWLLALNSTEERWEQMLLALACAFGLSHRWSEKPGCLRHIDSAWAAKKGLRSNKVCRQCSASIGYRNRVVCNEGVRLKGHGGTFIAPAL